MDFLLNLKKGQIEKHKFWGSISQFYKENTVPDIQLFVSCFPALNEFFKNDFASGRFYTWLEKYAEANPEKAHEVLTEIEAKDTKDHYEFWASVVCGLHQVGEFKESDIIEKLNTKDAYKISAALRAATTIIPKKPKQFYKETSSKIEIENLISILEDIDWAYLFNLSASKYHIESSFRKKLIAILELESDYIHRAAVNAIGHTIKSEEDKELYDTVLAKLSKTPLEYKGIYNSINYMFRDEYVTNPEYVTHFLEQWVEHHMPQASSIDCLKHLLSDFQAKNPEEFYRVISSWLIKSQKHSLAVQYIITAIDVNLLTLKLNNKWLKSLKPDMACVLSFRIIGFIWDKDVAYKLLLQVLKIQINSQEVINTVAQLMYFELLMNYPSLIEKLEQEDTGKNKRYASVVSQLIQKSNEFFDKLGKLKYCKEFEPSERRLSYYNKIQFKGIGLDKADKEPTFLDFADKTRLRAGKAFFSCYQGEFTETLEPKRISTSMEMPRLEFIDPVGQQARRVRYRYITKDELSNT